MNDTVRNIRLSINGVPSVPSFVLNQTQAKLQRWQLLKTIIEKVCASQFPRRTVTNPL